jgi:hypothetical protein
VGPHRWVVPENDQQLGMKNIIELAGNAFFKAFFGKGYYNTKK